MDTGLDILTALIVNSRKNLDHPRNIHNRLEGQSQVD